MNDRFVKYFCGELNKQEKEELLLHVSNNQNLKKEFIEIQNLIGISDLFLRKDDQKQARLSLSVFTKQLNKNI